MLKIIISCDDGNLSDIRLARLLKKYKLPCIFFIPTNCQLEDEDIKKLSKDGFEIGGHTQTHPSDMKLLDGVELLEEVGGNKNWLESLIDKKIEWFCYPSGRYNETTIEAVKMAGFKYARTTVIGETLEPKDNYRIKTSIHVYPHRKEINGQNWLDYAKMKYDEAKVSGGVFHLWCHSWELTKYKIWDELEELFKYITL